MKKPSERFSLAKTRGKQRGSGTFKAPAYCLSPSHRNRASHLPGRLQPFIPELSQHRWRRCKLFASNPLNSY